MVVRFIVHVDPPQTQGISADISLTRAQPLLGKVRFLGVALIWTVLLLAAIEIVLRLFLWSPKNWFSDPEVGTYRTPNTEMMQSQEGYSQNRVNSLGLMSPEIGAKTRPRVVFIGDSFTEALEVSQPERFASRIQAQLPDVEVINAGQMGFSPVNGLRLVLKLRREVQPDLVVIGLNDGDVDDLFDTTRLHLATSPDGTFGIAREEKAESFRELRDFVEPLSRHSALFYFLFSRGMLRVHNQQDRLAEKFRSPSGTPEISPVPSLSPDMKRAVPWLFAEFKKLELPLVVLYFPGLDYALDGCHRQRTDVGELYHQSADQLGIPIVDVGDDFCARFLATHEPSNGFNNGHAGVGHLNLVGHQIIADRAAPVIHRTLEESARPSEGAQ